METIKKIALAFGQFKRDLSEFFLSDKKRISTSNLCMLKIFSILGIILLFLFLGITPFIIHSWEASYHYFVFIPVFLAFLIFALIYSKNEEPNSAIVQGACLAFIISVTFLIIVISVFPYPNAPAAFMTIFIMVLPLMFIFKVRTSSALIFISEILYIFCVVKFKNPIVHEYDIFTSVAATIFSQVTLFYLCGIRAYENKSRINYKRLSRIDMLTDILNKVTCEEQCKEYIKNKGKDKDCALMIIDVDDFKELNDTFGHRQGDEFLKRIGNSLRQICRKDDIVGRIGGDEFLVLIKDTTNNPELAKKKADEIIENIRHIFSDITLKHFSCSVGISNTNGRELSYDTMFYQADKALYAVKASNKNHSKVFDENEAIDDERLHVLLIYGDELGRAVLADYIEDRYTVLQAENSIMAMEYMKRFYSKIRIVILDMEIMRVDGFRIMGYLINIKKYNKIPVLMITESDEDRQRAYKMGAIGILSKPFDSQLVRGKINEFINGIEKR